MDNPSTKISELLILPLEDLTSGLGGTRPGDHGILGIVAGGEPWFGDYFGARMEIAKGALITSITPIVQSATVLADPQILMIWFLH